MQRLTKKNMHYTIFVLFGDFFARIMPARQGEHSLWRCLCVQRYLPSSPPFHPSCCATCLVCSRHGWPWPLPHRRCRSLPTARHPITALLSPVGVTSRASSAPAASTVVSPVLLLLPPSAHAYPDEDADPCASYQDAHSHSHSYPNTHLHFHRYRHSYSNSYSNQDAHAGTYRHPSSPPERQRFLLVQRAILAGVFCQLHH